MNTCCIKQMEEEEDAAWSWERVGAVIFTLAFPVCFFCSYGLYCFFCNKNKPAVDYKIYFIFKTVWTILLAFLWGLWTHWLPCWWLACDLGDHDDSDLRGVLLFVTWPVYLIVFSGICDLGCDFCPVKKHKTSSEWRI